MKALAADHEAKGENRGRWDLWKLHRAGTRGRDLDRA